jgi:hypothetical protein
MDDLECLLSLNLSFVEFCFLLVIDLLPEFANQLELLDPLHLCIQLLPLLGFYQLDIPHLLLHDDLPLALNLLLSFDLLFVLHPLQKTMLVVLLLPCLSLLDLPLLPQLSIKHLSQLLLLARTQGSFLPPLIFVLLLLILYDLYPLVLREVTREGLGLGRLNTLVSQLETQVREMLVVRGNVLSGLMLRSI